ncbi:MAG: hypothetical protein ACREOV_05630 [Candidatus Dormibacteraceae bacterium]
MLAAQFPDTIGSFTSGVDGASEGGRQSTSRLPSSLVLYSVPLLDQLRRDGYGGKLTAEPALQPDGWAIKLVYDGDRPAGVPERWHGHRVVVEAAPAPPPEERK